MHQFAIMGILQGSSHLLHIGDDGSRWQTTALWVTLAQGAVGGIVHDEKRRARVNAEVEHTHDMRMFETGNGASFIEKAFDIFVCQPHLEDFDGGLRSEINMLAEVDIAEAALSYQARKAVVAKLLSYTVCHLHCLFLSD